MTEMPGGQTEFATDPGGRWPDPTRRYIIVAAILLVIILVSAILLLIFGLPALRGDGEATEVPTAVATVTSVRTFTPEPTTAATAEATATPVPSPTAGPPELIMQDTDEPIYEYVAAGARPGTEWTGFFGQVVDAEGEPVAGVPVVVWYANSEGRVAAGPVLTDEEGNYEVHVAGAPFEGTWSLQLLTTEYEPASKLFTFATDVDTEQGVQQIQVLWQEAGP